MHDISLSSAGSSFDYTMPVQEPQNRFASATANSAPPAGTTSIAQATGGREMLAAAPGMKSHLLKAFDAQRSQINTQAGPSNNRHLNALDELQRRDFQPAPGGLEIPLTPNSLLGGYRNTAEIVTLRNQIQARQQELQSTVAAMAQAGPTGTNRNALARRARELAGEVTGLQSQLSDLLNPTGGNAPAA